MAVEGLVALMSNTRRETKKESCWALSNLAAGTSPQIQRVIDSGAMVRALGFVNDTDAVL